MRTHHPVEEEATEPSPEEEIAVEEPELVPEVPEIGGGDASDDEFEEDVELPVIEDPPAPVVIPEATVAEYPALYDPKMINMAIDFDGDLESDDLEIPVTEGFVLMAPAELPNKMRQAGRLEFKALSSFDFDTTDVTPEVSGRSRSTSTWRLSARPTWRRALRWSRCAVWTSCDPPCP